MMLLEEPKPSIKDWEKLLSAFFALEESPLWRKLSPTKPLAFRIRLSAEEPESLCSLIVGSEPDELRADILMDGESLRQYAALLEVAEKSRAEQARQIYKLSISLMPPHLFEPAERARVEEISSISGHTALPHFRSMRPGFAPHPLTAREAVQATCVLEGLRILEGRLLDGSLQPPALSTKSYCVSHSVKGTWQSRIESLMALPHRPVEVKVDPELVAYLSQRRQEPMTIEADCSVFEGLSVGDGEEGAITPYGLLMVDPDSSSMLATEVLDPSEGLREMWALVPNIILIKLAEFGFRPETVRLQSPLLKQLFEPYATKLGINLQVVAEMPALAHAKRTFLHYMTDRN